VQADVAELIAAALEHASPALVPAASRDALRAVVPRPAEALAVGLECRLGARDDHKVDLGLCLRPEGTPAEVDAVFLEFDQEAGRFERAPLAFWRFGAGVPCAEARALIAAFGAGADALGAFDALVASLPTSTRVTDIGSLSARPGGTLRVGLLVAADALARDLPRGCAALVSELAADHEQLRVQYDLVAPARWVGIELHHAHTPHEAGTWAQAWERLVARGVCTPAQRDALARWPGRHAARLPRLGWCAIARTISHLKLTVDPAGEVCAKVYVFVEAVPPL